MKKLLFIFAILFNTFLFSQNSESYTFGDVIKTSDSLKTSKTLYALAKVWFANSFKDPKEVIVLDDSTNNVLIGRGNLRYISKIFVGSAAREGWIAFDVQIACKDGRYKYTFSNFIHEGNSVNYGLVTTDSFLPTMKGFTAGGPEKYKIKVTNEIRDIIKTKIDSLILSLKSTMDKQIASKEEW